MPIALEAKKQVLILAASTLMTDTQEEALVLKRIPFIYYPVQFKNDVDEIQALINSESEVNTMVSAYIKKLLPDAKDQYWGPKDWWNNFENIWYGYSRLLSPR